MALLLTLVVTVLIVSLFGFPTSGLSLALLATYVVLQLIFRLVARRQPSSFVALDLEPPPRDNAEDQVIPPPSGLPTATFAPPRKRDLCVDWRGHFPLVRQELQRALGPAYAVGDQLGRGGFGVVVAVTDLTLRRELAVKVVGRDHNADALVRFQREATILAGLRHPHIVPVFFFGSTPDLVFMVMPRISGISLRTRLGVPSISTNGLSVPTGMSLLEVGRILEQTASALDAAHGAHVIHRDVKPENLLLEGEGQHVHVVDFGVAKLVEPEANPILRGTIIGTWAYMSPEQCTGSPHIDHRSDVYSLGCVVYEMLAGRPPFVSARAGPLAFLDYAEAHLREAPAAIRQWRPNCSAETEAAVLKALAKNPSDRFQTASAFAEAFSAAMKN